MRVKKSLATCVPHTHFFGGRGVRALDTMSLRIVFLVGALAGVLGRGSPLEPASPLGPRESRREKGAAYESREYARQQRRRESERRNRGAEARAEEARAREETHLVQDDDLSPEKQQVQHKSERERARESESERERERESESESESERERSKSTSEFVS